MNRNKSSSTRNAGKIIHLTKPQTDFLMADVGVENYYKIIALVTGYGGGKSFCLTIKLIQLALKYPNLDILYIMPTFSMFRDILYPLLYELLDGTSIQLKINKTTGEILIGDGIGRVILKSADNPETIIGVNAVAVFLDEIDTLILKKSILVLQKSIARGRKSVPLLDENGNQLYDEDGEIRYEINRIYIGSTPEGMRLLYKLFVKEKHDNYLMVQASGRTNKFLPADYYDNLKQMYPENIADAYIDGKFVNMSTGSVYKNFDRIESHSDEKYIPGEPIFVSMDFNVINCNSIIFVKRGSLQDYGKSVDGYMYNAKPTMIAVDHLYSILDTPTTIETLKNKYPLSSVTCFPDSSGKNASTRGFTVSDISLLKQAKFQCKYPNKNPAIMSRVLAVNSAFKTGLIKVNTDKCQKLTEALEEQAFSESTGLPEKFPGASIDDTTDAFGYMVHYLFPIKRNSFRSVKYKEGMS